MDSNPAHARAIVGLYMQGFQALGILAAANLGIADELATAPRSIEELANRLAVDARALFRLMRALASRGIFRETGARVFANSALSQALRTGTPGGARELIRAFGLKSTRRSTVSYEEAIATGRAALELELGCQGPFDMLAADPTEAQIYDAGMAAAATAQAQSILDAFDFSSFQRLVDVGGGRGALLARILAKHPTLRGVLHDLPRVLERSPDLLAEHDVAQRCEVLPGDFLVDVPAGGDAYILKNILHGCSDERAQRVLANIHRRAAPAAHVLIIEMVMPGAPQAPEPAQALFDLFLLLGGTDSRMRSESEFRELLRSAGFEPLRVVPTASLACIVEARRIP